MKFKNKNIYFTSDTHYHHTNYCKGITNWNNKDSARDFDNIEQMNDTIVNNINNTVKSDDIIIHVGDWSFGGFDNIEIFRKRLNCQNIILILGNHDHHILRNKLNIQNLFKFVSPLYEFEIDKRKFSCCHYPIESWKDMEMGSYMIHGHLHSKPYENIGIGRKIDVGLDTHPEFRPYHLEEILYLLKDKINILRH